jgi:3-deoxy-D-manno-octulosonic acid kinase
VTLRVPPDFVLVRAGPRVVLVRRGLEDPLGALLMDAPHDVPAGGERLAGGRGGAYRARLAGGEPIVVRICRRGGLLGGLLRDRYFRVGGRLPRPFAEVAITEEARRRGVPGPEPLGARIDHLRAGWYRGLVVTRYLPATESLWDSLRCSGEPARRRAIAWAAGRAIGALGAAGIYHPDLNLLNCVVRCGRDAVEAFIVDFDRARMAGTRRSPRIRERMLRRLERSAAKLDPTRAVVTPEDLRTLRQATETTP